MWKILTRNVVCPRSSSPRSLGNIPPKILIPSFSWEENLRSKVLCKNIPVPSELDQFLIMIMIFASPVTHQLHISSEVRARKTAQIRFWILGTTCSGGTRCRMAALRFVFCELFRGNLVLIVRPVVKPTCLCSSEYKRCLLLGHAAPSLLLSVRTAGMLGTCG